MLYAGPDMSTKTNVDINWYKYVDIMGEPQSGHGTRILYFHRYMELEIILSNIHPRQLH